MLKTYNLFTLSILLLNTSKSFAQSYFATGSHILYKIETSESGCECSFNFIASTDSYPQALTMCPDTSLVAQATPDLFQIDTLTGGFTQIFSSPLLIYPTALLGVGGGIYYSISNQNDLLYRFNVNTGTLTFMGFTGHACKGDLTLYNGEIYYAGVGEILKLDTNNLSNTIPIVTFNPNYLIVGLTASPFCNSLLGIGGFLFTTPDLILISLVDGAITKLCKFPDEIWHINFLTSMLEFAPSPPCNIYLDLDCDDSSGAINADYNSPNFDCLSNGVGINDEDTRMFYDAIITQMTIRITGFVPDDPLEILRSNGSVAGINVSGSGSDMIILTNAGGAKSTDFKDALRLIVYDNTSIYPTPGPRTVEVQFTTESGSMSNIATAFIEVNDHARVTIDLGPDQELCDGETFTFNAGNPGAIYHWNTGQTTQTITVGNSGQYIVTVENGIDCPNQDTVELDIIPLIHIALTGEIEICDNEHANLTIETDAPFPLTIEITPNPGSPFSFSNVTGNYSFFDLISTATEYTITDVTSSQPACIELTDSTQLINVYPTYIHDVDTSLCAGDSIWFGYYWETDAGYYPILFNSQYGCDSTVNFTLHILPAVNISVQATTCDPAGVGVFITHLNNPAGCDTIVHTTVSLLPSDSTLISQTSCNFSSTGMFTQTLANQYGCDSIITTTVAYAISHYVDVNMTSCDSAALGIYMDTLTASDGCDSVVTTTVAYAISHYNDVQVTSCDSSALGIYIDTLTASDGCDSIITTTVAYAISHYSDVYATSCDSASLGVFIDTLIALDGCDSIVTTTVTYAISDFTNITATSCDPAKSGVFMDTLTNQFGCDSIVTQAVTLLPSDQTNITSTTCYPSLAGVFIHSLTNQFGCDSIVTETIDLLPSDVTSVFSTTCMSSQAGVFVTNLINQYGCDSTVTITVTLIPADTTILSFKTCDPNQVGSIQNTFTNVDGCDSLVIEQTDLFPLPDLSVEVSSDFNGFDISCFGESDGSAIAKVIGVSPFSYTWSTGETDQSITGLSAGLYTVTITDGDGCKTNGEVTLLDPGPFSITFLVSQPDCFDQHNGSITVNQTGGVIPIRYSIDGINFQPSPTFISLDGGTYNVTALDANDCEVKEIIWINVPLAVNVDLGDDRIIQPGDTTIIQAIVNVPYDSLKSITWSGLSNPNCPTCLTQPVAPIITTTYSVFVMSIDDCADSDTMTLFLKRNIDLYVPNIFSPNGDNINDRLMIDAGDDVQEISSFVIYDRWGNMVFSADHFQSNDLNNSWDGTLKGKVLNSAVFAYRMIVVFKDGRQQMRYGDVTLVR